jgi:hypothetical protein
MIQQSLWLESMFTTVLSEGGENCDMALDFSKAVQMTHFDPAKEAELFAYDATGK